MRLSTLLVIGFIGFAVSAAPAQDPVSLERTLARTAPDVIKHLKDKGYQNVGVLKFLVVKGDDQKLSDNAGTLNRTVARQLEMGLILANDPLKPIGIIDDASSVAAKTPGANHLSKEGRLKLFEPSYPLAWGKEDVMADAFVTGIIGISPDLKTLSVQLLAFDAKTNKLEPLGKELVAKNDSRKLSEIGESFSRGAFDDGNIETKRDPKDLAKHEQQVLDHAAQVKKEEAKNPVLEDNTPIRLEVLYDDKVIPFEIKGGKAFIPEPAEGQKVTLRVKHAAKSGIFGCVVKVNGENTLFRERFPDLQCRKWLVFPENKAGIDIIGFQKNDTTTEQFRVLSKAESKAREIDYGADVGTITLTVFRDRKGMPPVGELGKEAEITKVLQDAHPPENKPMNFHALTARMLDDANRGLIGEGNTVGSEIKQVEFKSDPIPVMCLTVVYYKKQ
ncbi:hypothetical protein [Zavarzinella formosa]|uniref:hypothetical protein n=1 Tax=Zavarzinella formosa TaxID=360055 RepID=UPI0002D412B2|nr:hypothetical protein [Zavarzinella formosa]